MASQFHDAWSRFWRLLRVAGSEAKKEPLILANPVELKRVVRDSPLRRTLDPRIQVWEKQIEDAYHAGNWVKVVDIMRAVLRITSAMDTPENRLKLIHSHSMLGHLESVNSQFDISLRRHPDSGILLLARAEHAMAQGDYITALKYWNRGLQASPDRERRALPQTGAFFVWDESSWVCCAQAWDDAWLDGEESPSAHLFRAVISTMFAAHEYDWARHLSVRAIGSFPDDDQLAQNAAETVVRCSPDIGTDRLVEALRSGRPGSATEQLVDGLERAEPVLREITEMGPTPQDELRVLNVYRHTPVDLLVRGNNFWDERRIHDEALRLAVRDGWPEQTADTDLVSAGAWEAAQGFAESRAELVGITKQALARSVFHYFKQELTQKIPVDRIADEISRTRQDEPVFIDLPSMKLPYMVSYPTSRMQGLYFYHALRKRGCNVFLTRFPRRPEAPVDEPMAPEPTSMPTLVLVPQPAQLKPPARPLRPVKGATSSIIVPAGIRSVRRVLERVDGALVVNSGSAVKEFAYDRSIKQSWDYEVNVSLHGSDKDLLPTFRIKTQPVRTWRLYGGEVTGSPAAPSVPEPIDAFVSSGVWEVPDWNDWLEQAIVPYFRDLIRRIRKTVEDRSIVDAHVGDYLYAESALVAAVVKERGGRVHIWPHSTNPVHVALQDPQLIDTVHAVTKSGAAMWAQALPTARVQHDAGLMLDPPSPDVDFVAGAPLSIVVVGGRPVMRHLPILDIAAHEDLYRRFFASLEPMVEEGRVQVYFKPRGLTGEHEGWLERVVGRSAAWKPVLEHPLRMNLTNPVFVSLSVGSSALLEGGTRGIPGFIVREGFARDYLATEDGLFQGLSVTAAAQHLECLATAEGWTASRNELMEGLVRELTPSAENGGPDSCLFDQGQPSVKEHR